MNCDAFEQMLAETLAGSPDVPPPAERLGRMRQHARACAACAGVAVLLDWVELGPEGRASGNDPGERYWHDFERRLEARREIEERKRRRRFGGLRAAAAVAALAIVGVWWLASPAPDRTPAPANAELPEPLTRLIEAHGVDETLGAMELVTGDEWERGPRGDAVLGSEEDPATDDVELRRELLEWLQDRIAASGEVRS